MGYAQNLKAFIRSVQDTEISDAAIAIRGREYLYGDSEAEQKSDAGDNQKGSCQDSSPLIGGLFLCERNRDEAYGT